MEVETGKTVLSTILTLPPERGVAAIEDIEKVKGDGTWPCGSSTAWASGEGGSEVHVSISRSLVGIDRPTRWEDVQLGTGDIVKSGHVGLEVFGENILRDMGHPISQLMDDVDEYEF